MHALSGEKYWLSVVVPTYNRAQQLGYTLKSLSDQTLDRSAFEVVVIDDGSTDESFQVAKGFEHRLNLKYAYQMDQGYRVASARNLGIRIAEGAICVFVDSGVIAHSDCLRQHLRCHRTNRRAVAVIGYTYGWGEYELSGVVDPNNADEAIARLVAMGTVFDIRENVFRKYDYDIGRLSVPWTLYYGGHSSARKASLFQVGLFDEHYDGKWGVEDQDLGYRLHQDGQLIVLCRSATVLHLPLPADRAARERQASENCRYFHQKYQTLQSRVFLDAYERDNVAWQMSHKEVVDFHELFLAAEARQPRADGGTGMEAPRRRSDRERASERGAGNRR